MKPVRDRISAIPTTYADVNFRSRLEARWAVLFDLLRWRWDYEPFDGPGIIPDFLVVAGNARQFIIEVKPVADFAVIAHRRNELHRQFQGRILEPLLQNLRLLDEHENTDLADTDALLADIDGVERGQDAVTGSLRVLVTGPGPFVDHVRNACSVDGHHYFVDCGDGLVGLAKIGERCSLCAGACQPVQSRVILNLWRGTLNPTQWKPSE